MALPARSAKCAAPIAQPNRPGGHLLPAEESASLLLWAWPRLIGWPRSINWIFSPVVGNMKYPGDLWGIDTRGELLIVETKLDRAQSPQNPLEDFVPYCVSPLVSKRWYAESLYRRWSSLVEHEENFLRAYAAQLSPHAKLTGTYRGVLPYSRHRDTIWRWQELFRERIVPRFQSGSYRRAVERSFRNRRKRGNPPPVYVGVIATVVPQDPRLSRNGERALVTLARRVGRQRVLLRMMRIEPDGSARIRIRSCTMRNASVQPGT